MIPQKRQDRLLKKVLITPGKYQHELHCADCLDILKQFQAERGEFIDLIYIDPPFNSGKNRYTSAKTPKMAFMDVWSKVPFKENLHEINNIDSKLCDLIKLLSKTTNDLSYLSYMTIRIYFMHKVLKKNGSFYIHSDPNMCHYLKIICDYIFRKTNFKNQIIWERTNISRSSKARSSKFPVNHDVILSWGKGKKTIFNKLYFPYSDGYINRKFREKDKAGNVFRWQVLATFSKKRFQELKKENRIRRLPGAKHYEYQQFLSDSKGIRISDIWTQDDIKPLNAIDKRFNGYPSQKPEKLLERIILSSSNTGDIVADFFCGSGTTLKAAKNHERKFIGVDISKEAIKMCDIYI
jgi:adenine specific DNA methylase Mod